MKKSIKPILIKIVQIEKLVSALKTDYEKSFGELSDELQSYLKNNQ